MKKALCVFFAVLILILGTVLPSYAWRTGYAHPVGHGRVVVGGGIFIGPGWWGPRWGGASWWGPSYPYYLSPPVVIEQQPPIYVQPEAQTHQPYYWYYCQNPQGYYPYVKNCPGGWMKVVPNVTPPNQ